MTNGVKIGSVSIRIRRQKRQENILNTFLEILGKFVNENGLFWTYWRDFVDKNELFWKFS